MRSMVNICKLLINVVIENKPKVLTGSAKMAREREGRLTHLAFAEHKLPGGEAGPNPRGCLHGTW